MIITLVNYDNFFMTTQDDKEHFYISSDFFELFKGDILSLDEQRILLFLFSESARYKSKSFKIEVAYISKWLKLGSKKFIISLEMLESKGFIKLTDGDIND